MCYLLTVVLVSFKGIFNPAALVSNQDKRVALGFVDTAVKRAHSNGP